MNMLKIIFTVIAAIYLIILLIFAIMTKTPIKTILFNGLLGIFLFSIIDLTSPLTGFWIPINNFTLLISLFGGPPAVLLLLALRFLIFI